MTSDESIALRPVETAPSITVAEAPTTARIVGTAGLFFLVLGAFAIGAHRIFSTPRMIAEGYGIIAVAFGLALMMYHAARDDEPEMRRLYGLFSLAVLALALGAALVPGPVFAKTADTVMGYNLPWTAALGFVGLAFLTLFIRNETDDGLRGVACLLLLVVGTLIMLVSLILGAMKPDFFAGPGAALAVLGLAFLGAFLGSTDTTDGLGFQVARGLGVLGLVVFYAALARTIFPTVLLEGPQALKKANGAIDSWKVIARVVGALVFLAPAVIAYFQKSSRALVGLLAILGLIGVGVLVAGSVRADSSMALDPFLVPRGVTLMALGLIAMAMSLGVCSESQFVTLTRRELGAYFSSSIGYLVLLAMALVQWFAYLTFVEAIVPPAGLQRERVLPEPIVRFYFVDLLPVLSLLLLVPALTMRLLAEERRSGSLEILLTSPVSEARIVLSKFLATWIFFLLVWVPAGLFLITLRLENGESFDYRPLLTFYLGMAASGAAFVAMGLFFSAVSPNQLAAAAFTFVGMILFLLCFLGKEWVYVGPTMKLLMERFSFVDLWQETLKGQLPLRSVIAWLSLATFWLFASVKVLEARRWL